MKAKYLMLFVSVFTLSGCGLFGSEQAMKAQDKASDATDKVNELSKETTKKLEEVEGEMGGKPFSGTMKAAMELGVPMKCSWNYDNNSGESIVRGNNVYTKVAVDGNSSEIITKDKCMWAWSDQMKGQGVKMCSEEDMTDNDTYEDYGGAPADMNYKCVPTVVTAATFTPPADVNFIDMSEMMNNVNEGDMDALKEMSEQMK